LPRKRFDVVDVGCALPDGVGLDLAPLVHKVSPATKIIVLADVMSPDAVIQAMRCGAVDCLAVPATTDGMEDFLRRLEPALLKSRAERQRDERLLRLKKVCRELNIARHEISKQVDALCDDLSNAYREIADQMSDVALASEFRTLLKQELDVEDLLRTTLEYLLTKTGPTNAAVFLPDAPRPKHSNDDQHYGLGAYVNYDCPRETISLLLDHLGGAICPQMADEMDIVAFTDAKEFAEWIGEDLEGAEFLANSNVIAFSCVHNGECLAVIVLFRDQATPFDDKLAGAIDTMRQIIAEQLSNVIKVHQRARPSWPKKAAEGDLDYHDDDLGFGGYEGGMAA
jgi:FixJ family two-component response regulator